jgi:hypothetical protein
VGTTWRASVDSHVVYFARNERQLEKVSILKSERQGVRDGVRARVDEIHLSGRFDGTRLARRTKFCRAGCVRQGREMREIRDVSEIRTSLPNNMCDGDELMSAMNIGLGEGRTGSRTAK